MHDHRYEMHKHTTTMAGMPNRKRFVQWFMLLCCWLITTSVIAEDDDFLSVNDAFQLNWSVNANDVEVSWQIATGYYLYHDKLRLDISSPGSNGVYSIPLDAEGIRWETPPHLKEDAFFGNVEVHTNRLAMRLPAAMLSSAPDAVLKVRYQGCAEAGLCYPPQNREIPLASAVPSSGASAASSTPAGNTTTISTAAFPPAPQHAAEPVTTTLPASAGDITTYLQNAGLLINLMTFFVLGLGLAFTPCVLPMVPILSSIIVGQGETLTQRKALGLSSVFVLGMATAYALAGVAVGYFGARANLQMWMQTPWVIALFAGLFVVLAMSMFGFYELQLPEPLRSRLMNLNQRQQGGTYAGVGLMGVLSALVASPCVSAPLAGVLVYISTTGDALLGGAALFFLSLGMGAPLLLVAVGGGRLLPRSGAWMVKVKNVFGVLLLAVAIWMLQRIVPMSIALALWAALLVISGIHLHALEPVQTVWGKTFKGIGLLLVTIGLTLLYNGLHHPDSPLHLPTARQATAPTNQQTPEEAQPIFRRISNLAELHSAIATAGEQGRWVMLDYYADWCASCQTMEKEVFHAAEMSALQASMTFLQFDVTDVTAQTQEALEAFGLFGPPSMVFFSPNGQEIKTARIQGEMGKAQFLRHVQEKVLEQNVASAS